ncbi:MAG: endopeptidase La [Planctomycetes bacterium]|nr:endopeptidase La [Planctomycetota bacterium]
MRDLPVLPVRNVVVFPGTVVPISIGREKSKRLIDSVLAGNKMLAIFAQRQEEIEDPGIDDVYRVGTASTVLKLLRMPDGTNSLLVHGLMRVGLEEFIETDPFWRARVNPHEDQTDHSLELEALAHSARRTAEQVIDLSPNVPDEAQQILATIEKPGGLADFLAANLSLGLVQKQELLETFDIQDRLRKVNATLNNQLEILQLSQKIQSDVRGQIDKSQREYYLQEQLRAIQKELGETDSRAGEIAELREQIDAAGMPEPVLKEANRELKRFGRISQNSPEHGVIRNYLDWMCELPWTKSTDDNLDLDQAQAVLDADHYGLDQIKRRILEYLAVRKLKPDGRGPILCFAGPPGVGKTSLGQSIARALGRKFIRLSLGGVRDEADIRGHRRTYIGAMPGRIIQEIRKAGTNNPVLMLDEMDKIGSDFRGDPAAALLEVLDPQQNHNFTDHYLGVPFDLSKVFFIATANYLDPVAPPLRDRMEILEIAGYTTAEKLEIARRYLVARRMEQTGLGDRKIEIEDAALRTIIDGHTREAGVRSLERKIGTVCRGLAAKVARGKRVPKTVRVKALEEFLGPIRFEREVALRTATPGVVTGLAYTPVGGEIIFIEAAQMPGRGVISLTGLIGEVMTESAQAALSLVRSRVDEWKISVDHLPETDIHIHVPAGGIPKDGPSAGVAMVTAFVSLFTNQTVNPSVGMTGEISLRGLVLPIGGVKEKVLAAHRAGLKTVILPARNKVDLREVPEQIRDEMSFVLADVIEDVLEAAFESKPVRAKWRRAKARPSAEKKKSRKVEKKAIAANRRRSPRPSDRRRRAARTAR